MSFSSKRNDELISILDVPGGPPADVAVMKQAVTEWTKKRAEHLDALLLILGEETVDPRFEAWRNRTALLRGDLGFFCKTDSRLPQPPQASSLAFVLATATEDDAFVSAIEAAVVAVHCRDYLTRYYQDIVKETENLEVKWNSLKDKHLNHATGQLEVLDQVAQLIASTVTNNEKLHVQLASAIKQTQATLERLPEGGADAVGVPFNNAIQTVAAGLTYFEAAKMGFADQVARFRVYASEDLGGPLLLFGQFRGDTKKFVDELGYRHAEKKLEEAKSVLDGLVSRGRTSGENGRDMESFVTAAHILVLGHLQKAKRAWESFVEKHGPKFFGPLSPDTTRILHDRVVIESKVARIEARDLLELMEKWRHESRMMLEIDLAGLPAHVADQYRAAMREKLEDIDEVMRDPFVTRTVDATKAVVENTWRFIKEL